MLLRPSLMAIGLCGFCMITLEQCRKEEVTCVPLVNQIILIQNGHTATNCQPPMSLKFVGVQSDSRCPTGVNCASAGYAEVVFDLTSGDSLKSFILNTNTPKYITSFGYKVELIGLTPQPSSSIKIDPNTYKATVKVSPQ
jgi:hypothetical protein